MGDVFQTIDQGLEDWIGEQKLFFVSTSPLAADGHINSSPKGLDSFRVLGPTSVAYADFNGSGIETAAHLKENGRILIMMCAFAGPPRIVRLHGVGEYLEPGMERFDQLNSEFGIESLRGIVSVQLKRISDSCGYGVPKYEFVEDRRALPKWCDSLTAKQMSDYQQGNNSTSIDGLPGI
jgi:hypothetical protein